MSENQQREQTNDSNAEPASPEDHSLLIRNLVIATCLAVLGMFVTGISILTVLIAGNINVLDWME